MACNVLKIALAVEPACLATLKIFVTTVSTKSKDWLEIPFEDEIKSRPTETYFNRIDDRSSVSESASGGFSGVKSINGTDCVCIGSSFIDGNDKKFERLSLSLIVELWRVSPEQEWSQIRFSFRSNVLHVESIEPLRGKM